MNTPQEESVIAPAKKSPESIQSFCDYYEAESARYLLCRDILRRLGTRLSYGVIFSPSLYISIMVSTREDLSVLMELAPKWDKAPTEYGINYSAQVEGRQVQIQSTGAALPSTCRLIEEEYEIPAIEAKPASIGKRMVLKCDKPEGIA